MALIRTARFVGKSHRVRDGSTGTLGEIGARGTVAERQPDEALKQRLYRPIGVVPDDGLPILPGLRVERPSSR